MIPDSNKFPPLYVELGYEEIAPHVFRLEGRNNGGGVLSAEKTWEHLRENMRRLNERS